MICTTIINKDVKGVLAALEECEMAEIRLDSCDLSMKDIDEVFSSDVPLVATCRIAEVMAKEPSLQDPSMSEQSREIKAMQIAEKRLVKAIEAGARYVDVELEAQKQMSKRIRQAAHENGTVFIRSYHDFEGTDSPEALKAIVEKCVYHGADMVKIVTTAHSQEDVAKVLGLYDWCRKSILMLDAIESNFSNFHIRFLLELAVALGFSPESRDLMPFVGDHYQIVEDFMRRSFAESMLIPLNGPVRNEIAEEILRYIEFHTDSAVNINSLKVLRELFA